VVALLLVSLVFLAVGFGAAWFVKSPAQVAAEAKPPAAGLITAPLSKRAIANTVIVRGDAGYSDAIDVSVNAAGPAGVAAVVSGHVPAVGQVLQPGSVALEVSSRPVIVLPGLLPAFRTLRTGISGADVLQFKEALAALGIDPGNSSSDEFDAATAAAVSRLYDLVGYPVAVDESASVNGHLNFPAGGQEISPVVAMVFPMDGHEISPPVVRWPVA